ncbi:MAG: Gfo/Idh/MocA family oxidoreductase [Thermotogae bacterium]|nr:Gfo/Idh/MocA family oxidoreductase [Thermotogota bacterium]
MSKKWKIGLVGCGAIAAWNYLPELKTMSNVEIVSVCDIIPERAKNYSARFEVPEWYDNIDEMLLNSDFEILVDTASIPAHFEINMKALKAGKHLYSQKPLASSVKEINILIDEAKKRNLKISASPIHMLRPEIKKTRELVESGVIGKVNFVRCSSSHGGPEYFQYRDVDPSWFYRKDVGPLFDLGVHALHQVTGILGPAKAVVCLSGISERERIVRSGKFDGRTIKPEIDDNSLLMLEFEDSTFAFIDSTYCVKASRSPYMEIFGSKGTIVLRYDPSNRLELYLDDIEKNIRGWTIPIENWPEFKQSFGVKDLMEALEEDREPVLTPEHAKHVVEIIEKAYESSRSGKKILLETVF